MKNAFHGPRRGSGGDPEHRALLLRRLWVQTAIMLTLCFLVLASALALVETDRRISRSILELAKDHEFEELLREHQRAQDERYPDPAFVVLLSLGGLRADRLGADRSGADAPATSVTPNLDALAREATVFTTAGAQASHTLVSGKSLLTGKYPSTLMLEETGADLVTLASLDAQRDYLVRTFAGVGPTLGAGMRAAGYRTAAFTDGGWLCSENGFDRGFDLFEETPGGLDAVLEPLRDWAFRARGERAFLFVHSEALGCPYESPEPFRSSFCPDHAAHPDLAALCAGAPSEDGAWSEASLDALAAHYDGAAACMDARVGRLLDVLRELGLYEKALIVVTAVHGESLGERGRVGHGALALEELLVPLVIKFPRGWNVAPSRVTEPVELVDVLPTLFSSSGVRPARDLDGHSLLPIVLRNVRGRKHLVAQTSIDAPRTMESDSAVRSLLAPGQWMVVQDTRQGTMEIFSLKEDPRALDPIRDLDTRDVPPDLQALLGHRQTPPAGPTAAIRGSRTDPGGIVR